MSTSNSRAYLARVNSRGLHHDAMLLSEHLRARGYEVLHLTHPFQWKNVGITWSADVEPCPRKGDLVIFLENLCPLRDVVRSEARIVLIPNAELLSDTHVQWANSVCDEVWHKCRLSHAVYESLSFSKPRVPRHILMGFTSRDMYLPAVKKAWRSEFLHLYGTSPAKGTQELIRIWLKHPEWPTLVLVGTSAGNLNATPADNIRFRPHIPEKEHPEWMNKHGIHLCPSAAEGWGHYIVEAMACANVVITTDASPMNEHVVDGETGFLVPVKVAHPYRDFARTAIQDDRGNNMARWNVISEEGLKTVVHRVQALSEEELVQIGQRARRWFLANHERFIQRIQQIVPPAEASPRPVQEGA